MAKTSSAGQGEAQLICTPLARDCVVADRTSRGTGIRCSDWLPAWARPEGSWRAEKASRAAAKRRYCISITVNEVAENVGTQGDNPLDKAYKEYDRTVKMKCSRRRWRKLFFWLHQSGTMQSKSKRKTAEVRSQRGPWSCLSL